MAERQVRRPLDQVLEEQVIGALFDMADFQQRTPECQPCVLTDIVIREAGFTLCGAFGRGFCATLTLGSGFRFCCHVSVSLFGRLFSVAPALCQGPERCPDVSIKSWTPARGRDDNRESALSTCSKSAGLPPGTG